MKIFLGGNFLGGNYPGGNFPGGSFPGWKLSRWDLSWVGIFLGRSFPGGNYPMGIIRVGVFMLPGVIARRSHSKLFFKIDVLKNFAVFTFSF